MKRKVKKFGRGGDILTGIGAGLAGYGIYKALTKGKDQDDEYTKKVKEYGTKGRYPEESTHETVTESKAAREKTEESKAAREKTEGEKRAMATSQGRPEMGDVTPEMESDKASRATPAPKTKTKTKTKTTTGPKQSRPAAKTSTPEASDTAKFTSLYSKLTTRDKPSVADQQAAISTVQKLAEASKEKKTGAERRRGQGLTPYAPYTGPGSSSHAQMLRESRDPEKVRQRREESERKEKEAAKKRKGAADVQYDVMGNVINKRGGVIKKYASGGSVKTAKPTMRSASSRADGIAIRGKTRA